MTPKRLLLFAIDGTLIDSGGAGVYALRDVLEEKWGLTSDLAGVEMAGKTDASIGINGDSLVRDAGSLMKRVAMIHEKYHE